jgi:hypothetical protein
VSLPARAIQSPLNRRNEVSEELYSFIKGLIWRMGTEVCLAFPALDALRDGL